MIDDDDDDNAVLLLVGVGLIIIGLHVLVAFIMLPIAGYDFLATAAHFSAVSSAVSNVNVCSTFRRADV